MDKILKKIENGPTQEEFHQMVYDVYEGFRDVLKICQPREKQIAMESMNSFQTLMNQYMEQVQSDTQIDFQQVMEALLDSKTPVGEKVREIKKKVVSLKEEIEPLIEQAKAEGKKPLSKKARKRKMENRLKVKE